MNTQDKAAYIDQAYTDMADALAARKTWLAIDVIDGLRRRCPDEGNTILDELIGIGLQRPVATGDVRAPAEIFDPTG
jgi:hypothetical protein